MSIHFLSFAFLRLNSNTKTVSAFQFQKHTKKSIHNSSQFYHKYQK